MGSGQLAVHLKVALISAAQIAIMVVVVGTGLTGVFLVEDALEQLTRRDVPASRLLFELERDAFQSQLALEQSFDNPDLHQRDERLALHSRNFERLREHWAAFLEVAPETPEMTKLGAEFEARWQEWSDLALVVASVARQNESSTDPETRALIEQSREQFAALADVLTRLAHEGQVPAMERSLVQVEESVRALRTSRLALLGVGLLLGLGVARVGVRATRIQEQEIEKRERERQREHVQREFESRVQRAFEMAGSEEAAVDVVRRALGTAAPEHGAEFLLAKASRSRFQRVAASQAGSERPGCPVPTPSDCAAVRRGYSLAFEHSNALDACPYLQERGEAGCSAYCAPVTIGGSTVGVLHAVGPAGRPPDAAVRDALDHVAARTGERITYIQAFSRTEAAAATDPLTGLLNRRSLIERVRTISEEHQAFAVGYGDLDYFKQLNDRHGHDAGDRALCLFARVLRESVEKTDLCARWGGEEFVVVFLACNAENAKGALDRVRESLRAALAGTPGPPFTVSFGVADSSEGFDLDGVLNRADAALLAAKRAGRDQVVVAGAEPETKGEDEEAADLG